MDEGNRFGSARLSSQPAKLLLISFLSVNIFVFLLFLKFCCQILVLIIIKEIYYVRMKI